MPEPHKYQKLQPIEIHQPESSKTAYASPRNHIYVRAVKGFWSTLRKRMGWVAMLAFLMLPWLSWNDRQAVWFDLINQKFHIFGIIIWPQDLTLLAALLMVAAFALFFVTTYLGRVWCGYTCPQTVWTFIFIWFEEKIEGARNKRIALDKQQWNFNKVWRKGLKHFAWLTVALGTSLTFISFFVPATELYIDFFTGESAGLTYFWVIFFTFATYGNAGWMREIMCTHMCPYARFQSAMFDENTFIVGYDATRGEKRGPRSRKVDPKEKGLGDCIDCDLCVQVCPTGIDIRNGMQYECINCGNCIDACNNTMERMGYQQNLISYTTENKLAGKHQHTVRPKLVGYGVVLAIFTGLFTYALINIDPVRIDIIRDRNALYRMTHDGLVENTYTIKVLNKTEATQTYQISTEGVDVMRWTGPNQVTLKSGEILNVPISIATDQYELDKSIVNISFSVQSLENKEITATQESRFFSAFN
ncbi:cytochrome c oxidase accessory protein CcoG [Paraferrimonas sp. SM1919]|uniref:cytochrome c oxidase accessory protein CcoG n=1 Tax=Paraferrimonas sp. SM1919 TaxID=2662263 RepID=UPI0013D54336|nr:cytochrome c oxidase accessory protein CcoG [Paraferrimonas sp. SM1919]